ncbi:hypothetical protein [Nereida ignava]|uniref:hypothetical protein n=1 Tax=Nereida ignava TaxID=282199 RepID=UPI002FE2E1CD
MTDFYEELTEILEQEDVVDASYTLGEEWDSLAIVSTIALIDELHGIFLEGQDLAKCKSVQDILDLLKQNSV